MKIIIFGSSDFGIESFERCRTLGHTIVAVVSTPPAPKGRGLVKTPSAVHEWALKHNLSPIITPASPKDPEFIAQIEAVEADLFLVIAYRILPELVFTLPRFGTWNIHASILPHYRGPAPIHRAVEAGETETGVTIFKIDTGVDTGTILASLSTSINEHETTPEVYSRLSLLSAVLLEQSLPAIAGGSAVLHHQDSAKACKAPRLVKDEAKIDWGLSAQLIFNKIRAFKPFPGTYSIYNDKRIGIEWALPVTADLLGKPGEIISLNDRGAVVACGSGHLEILTVKPEGKRSMAAIDWINGARITTRSTFL